MQFNYFLGIDISKRTLDFCLLYQGKPVATGTCSNDSTAIKKMLVQQTAHVKQQLLIWAEHTGLYSFPLVAACQDSVLPLWIENPMVIKHSGGVMRGKNDQIDAYRIAQYAARFLDRVRLYQPQDGVLQKLKALNSEREMYVTDRAKYRGQLNDQQGFLAPSIYATKAGRLNSLIQQLTALIDQLEQEMDQLLHTSTYLSAQYKRITSVVGVGKQTAINTMIATQGFTSFQEARKFCCHAGVAPFAHLSGSSQKSRWKVSHQANKRLKKLYHMAALSAINREGELRQYYLRKVEEGKNKMSVINAVRAKLIHRVFAVIRDQREYKKDYAPAFG